MTPRSAYVHVPFCRHRCGYCNFTVVAGRDDLFESYLQAIETELRWLQAPREVDTIFLGGGTPTELPQAHLQRLLQLVKQWFPPAADCEWTVEANPEDVDTEVVDLLAENGVTRMSLGMQSFDEKKLATLERAHTAQDILRARKLARKAELRFSVDLIFATPHETLTTWENDLQQALALAPDHISTYGLTFERGTSFWKRLQNESLHELDDETWREMYLLAIHKLTEAGFEHYEVSNFARPQSRCRHNIACWQGKEYYAVGPGAARYVNGTRETNHRSTTTYLRKVLNGESPVAESETASPESVARECLVFGLRMLAGIDKQVFASQTGFEVEQLAGQEIQKYVEWGLLQDENDRIALTQAGLLVSDAIWPDLLVG
jgi:oxygen-independent coproporphyrinogen-3 oxidase